LELKNKLRKITTVTQMGIAITEEIVLIVLAVVVIAITRQLEIHLEARAARI